MGSLVGIDGRPLKRPERRELERDIIKNLGTIIPEIIQNIQYLAQRNDIIVETLKGMGVTDDQFKEAVNRINEKVKQREVTQ